MSIVLTINIVHDFAHASWCLWLLCSCESHCGFTAEGGLYHLQLLPPLSDRSAVVCLSVRLRFCGFSLAVGSWLLFVFFLLVLGDSQRLASVFDFFPVGLFFGPFVFPSYYDIYWWVVLVVQCWTIMSTLSFFSNWNYSFGWSIVWTINVHCVNNKRH